MEYRRTEIPLTSPVRSLCWNGDGLVDWAGGNRVFSLDREVSQASVNWAYRFDAAVQSPSGKIAVVYERLGTKAMVLEHGKFVRELNRSYYQADTYEYPVALCQREDGREMIAHCPEEYNRLEIEDAVTAERLTRSPSRKPDDFFHSRLAVSPDQRRLLSAGWIWHPFNTASTWVIADALEDATVFDHIGQPCGNCGTEINSAEFVDSQRVLVSSSPDAQSGKSGVAPRFAPGSLGVFNLTSNAFDSIAKIEKNLGTLMSLGDDQLIAFYEHPKVVDVSSGKILFEWPDILSGKQESSIIHHLESLPPLALDPKHKRFAVAANGRITVVQLG